MAHVNLSPHCPKCDRPMAFRCLDEKHEVPRIAVVALESVSNNVYTHDVAWPLHVELELPEKAHWTLTFLNGCTLVSSGSMDTPAKRLAFIANIPALDEDCASFQVAEVRVGCP